MAVTLHGRQLQWYMAALRATCLADTVLQVSFPSRKTDPSNHFPPPPTRCQDFGPMSPLPVMRSDDFYEPRPVAF